MDETLSQYVLQFIRPDPDIDFVEWADENFYLSREAASEYGQYRSIRTPFVIEPLKELSPNSDTEVVVVIKPTQCGGTTIALIFLCASADISPGPTLFMQPTESMCKSFSKKKLATCIKHIDRLKGKIAEPKSRASGNTILQKDFPGGSWMLTGSNSGSSFRQESIKYLIMDDFDGFEIDIDGEGDPRALADRRTGTFAGRKIYINSTTTIKETSNILRAYEASSQGRFEVPCPHCGHYQYLEWGDKTSEYGVKFETDDDNQVIDAWYQCSGCHGRIEERHKPEMFVSGKYTHKYSGRKTRGFKWNALYTPIGWINSWEYIAQEFVFAAKDLKQGNIERYKTWLNSFMSEAFEERGDQPEWTKLKARCEPYLPMVVPDNVQLLTSGTDVQHNRLAVSIFGWAPGEECYLIYHIEIFGDPMHDDVWEQHDQLIFRPYQKKNSQDLRISSAAVDAADGTTTHAVRNYCRFRAPIVFPVIGQINANKPIIGAPSKQDITWRGDKITNGIEIWPYGSSMAKSTIYARLNIDELGPGMMHFYVGLNDEYFMQLTAEKLVTRFVKGYPTREWQNVRGNKRNEALDCAGMALAAALRAGSSFMTPNSTNLKPKSNPKLPPTRAKIQPEKRSRRPKWLDR